MSGTNQSTEGSGPAPRSAAVSEGDLKARPARVVRVHFIQSLRTARWFLEGDLGEHLAQYGYCLEIGRARRATDQLPSIA